MDWQNILLMWGSGKTQQQSIIIIDFLCSPYNWSKWLMSHMYSWRMKMNIAEGWNLLVGNPWTAGYNLCRSGSMLSHENYRPRSILVHSELKHVPWPLAVVFISYFLVLFGILRRHACGDSFVCRCKAGTNPVNEFSSLQVYNIWNCWLIVTVHIPLQSSSEEETAICASVTTNLKVTLLQCTWNRKKHLNK